MSLLIRSRAALLVVDVQEGFRGYDCFEKVASSCAKLLATAGILEVPVIISEQYPRGLGQTVGELGELPTQPLEKSVFSAARAEGFDLAGRDQVIVCGIEAHVCVLQTAHDLIDSGVDVHIPADAVGSRHQQDSERALNRLGSAGATISTVESVLFELLECAGTPQFKSVQRLII